MKIKNDYTECKYRFHRLKSDEKGFSLLEVLIALVILAIGLLGLSQMQVMGIDGNARGNRLTTATTLAQDALEKLMNLNTAAFPGLDTAGNFDNDFPVYNNGVAALQKTLMGVNYTRSYMIDVDYPIADTATILVTVSWVDKSGNMHSVSEISTRGR